MFWSNKQILQAKKSLKIPKG